MNCSQSQTLENCDISTSEVFTDVQSYTDGPLNENQAPVLHSDISDNLLNNNSRDEDERDRSSVDSAEEVVPENTLSSPLVMSEVSEEITNNRNMHVGKFH